jgi:hypothetical protein
MYVFFIITSWYPLTVCFIHITTNQEVEHHDRLMTPTCQRRIKLSDEIDVLRLAIWQCYCLHVGETASLIIHHFRYLCKLINDDLLFMCTCIFFNLELNSVVIRKQRFNSLTKIV